MRLAITTSILLCFAATSQAGVDPDPRVPYQLRVVLHVGDHPDFSEFFRRELKRQLLGDLQAALGALGTVEVVDLRSIDRAKWEPLWKQVDEKGLESLSTFNEIGGGKTHFMRIEYANGHYDLQARQVDGTAGLASPIVRKARTHARAFVSRLAGLMIGQDFGLIATLEPGAGQNIFMRIKGSGLGPVDKWLKKGDVFAVSQINVGRMRVPPAAGVKAPPKIVTVYAGKRIDGVLVRAIADPKDGGVMCQLFNRYEDPLPTKSVIGYRCMRLGTTEGPLKLQLTDTNGLPQTASLLVYARAEDFPDGNKEAEQTTNQKNGLFVSTERFSNVAFVRVKMSGGRGLSRIPVEILDDQVQTRTIRLDVDAELRDRIDADRRGVISRITDGRLIQVRCFQEITALEQSGMKQQAFDRGQTVLNLLDSSASDLQEEIDRLRARAAKDAPTAVKSIGECDQQVTALRNKQDELRKHLESVKAAIAQDNDPTVQAKQKKINDILNRAQLLVQQAEIEKALTAYKEALDEVQDEPMAKLRIETVYTNLNNAWAIRDPEHQEARNYIYQKWPKLGGLDEVNGELANARKAFEKCHAVGDRYSILKMQLGGVEVATKFGDELKKKIDAATDDEEKKKLEVFQKVSEDLQKLLRDVEQALVAKK